MNTKTIMILAFATVIVGIIGIMAFKQSSKYSEEVAVTSVTLTQAPPAQSDVMANDNPVGSQEISLEITQPETNSTVSTPTVTIKGKTVPDAEVFINELSLVANKEGTFSVLFKLDEGENQIVINANDAKGQWAEKTLVITYEPK